MSNLMIILGVGEECIHIVNQLLLMFLYSNCKFKIDYRVIISAVIFLTLSVSLHILYDFAGVSLVLNIFIEFFVFMLLIRLSTRRKMIHFILILLLESLLIMIAEILTNSLKIGDEINSFLVSSLNAGIAFSIIAIIACWKYRKDKGKKTLEMNLHLEIYLIVGLVSGMILLKVVDFFSDKMVLNQSTAVVFLAFEIIFASAIMYRVYAKKHRESDRYEQDTLSLKLSLQLQEKYFHDMVSSYVDLKKFRHDVNGYFNAISQLVEDCKYDELRLLTNNLKKSTNSNILPESVMVS